MNTEPELLSPVSRGVIPSSELPSSETDSLARSTLARDLHKIFADEPGPLVVALDAPWGSGKSTFLRLFLSEYWKVEDKRTSIFIDAYAGDFGSSALETITESLLSQCCPPSSEDRPIFGRLKRALLKYLELIRKSSPEIVAGVGGIVGGTVAGPLGAAVAAPLARGAASSIADGPSVTPVDAREQFRSALQEIVELSEFKAPILVVIDELDRCEPAFALQLLARIKHLFDIEGVVFLLACQLEQLEEFASNGIARREQDHGYLTKLIHLRVSLPAPSSLPAGCFQNFCSKALQAVGLPLDERQLESFAALSLCAELSPREVERVASVLAVTERLEPLDRSLSLPHINLAVAILSVRNQQLLRDCASSSCDLNELSKSLRLEFKDVHESIMPIQLAEIALLAGRESASSLFKEEIGHLQRKVGTMRNLDVVVQATVRRLRPFI